ncbi:hypothetical protein M0802_010786 [Mischocyttarus mexicanus]|nr:hypothetical protein M0802_010786 [Mischocyttarus mexicanus]
MVGRQASIQADKQTSSQASKQASKQAGRQVSRQASKQAGRQTGNNGMPVDLAVSKSRILRRLVTYVPCLTAVWSGKEDSRGESVWRPSSNMRTDPVGLPKIP